MHTFLRISAQATQDLLMYLVLCHYKQRGMAELTAASTELEIFKSIGHST